MTPERPAPSEPIYVTRPQLPPLEEMLPLLQSIWESRVLTNGGPFHQRFERALCDYLGVPQVCLFTNATIALMTALQALRITGEVITTPYTFVATAHALMWNGIKPVFVDIDPQTLNLDPAKIEAAITPQTTAILPVHCYGRPCDVAAIQQIADTHNLRVIYDAAHAFGVQHAGSSVLNNGDLSVLSFHATKVLNTFEGGAIVCADVKTKTRIDRLKNFGFADETTVTAPGINGKMSEFNAALGLLQLQHVDQALTARRALGLLYTDRLADLAEIRCLDLQLTNFSYFPVRVVPGHARSRDQIYDELKRHGIFTRRYFYPLVSSFPMYRGLPSAQPDRLPVANTVADQVLCLPIYPEMAPSVIDRIAAIIRSA
jgi:dTDP-4-amino-4,6-dideoxygalactose transaminase